MNYVWLADYAIIGRWLQGKAVFVLLSYVVETKLIRGYHKSIQKPFEIICFRPQVIISEDTITLIS